MVRSPTASRRSRGTPPRDPPGPPARRAGQGPRLQRSPLLDSPGVRRLAVPLTFCLLLLACASDRVPLDYRNEPGRRLEHRLVLRADITRSLQGRTPQQKVVATFRAAQEVAETRGAGGTEVTV